MRICPTCQLPLPYSEKGGSTKVEEDVFEINNGSPVKAETLFWTIRLSSSAKVQALLKTIDALSKEN